MLAALAAKIGHGEPVKFVINERHQLVTGLFLTIAPSFEQLRDAFGRTGLSFAYLFLSGETIFESA